ERYRLMAVAGLGDDLDVLAGVEQRSQSAADQALIVGQQRADHRPDPAGRRALISKPPPTRRVTSSEPPTASARSRIPAMPLPGPPSGRPESLEARCHG